MGAKSVKSYNALDMKTWTGESGDMIREMRSGEEDKIRELLAKLSFEDQTFWRKQTRSLENYAAKYDETPIGKKVKGENIILVAEDRGVIVGLCWCTIADRGIDRQGEVAEFYVEKEFRGKGVGRELLSVAKELFLSQNVEVAFAWTHHGNKAATKLYEEAGFKLVDQVVMAFVPSDKNRDAANPRRQE
jgi:L-amino acid N-acyltransferase YncA